MNKRILLLFLFVSFTSNVMAQDPDPALFQTWYLYANYADLEDPQYFYGEDVPKLTIMSDLSFTANDNCWDISGDFIYTEGDGNFDFFLLTENYVEECTLGGSNGKLLYNVFNEDEPTGLYLFEGERDELEFVVAAGFGSAFRNEVTLSTEDFDLDNITFYPNPTANFITINGIQNNEISVTIYTISGAVVKRQSLANTANIDLSDLQVGVYFAEIASEGKTAVKKFIKE